MRYIAILLLPLIAACGQSGGGFSLETRAVTPDEFMVQTGQPLQMPTQFSELPEPELGGPNLAQPNSQDVLIRALGGRPR